MYIDKVFITDDIEISNFQEVFLERNGNWSLMVQFLYTSWFTRGEERSITLYGVTIGPNYVSWWSHQMEAFSELLALCVENSPVTDEFLSQKASNADFDVSLMWVRLSC